MSRTVSAPWTPTTVGIERKHSRVGSLTEIGMAGQEENAKCGLRRQFAKLSGHEAPHEEECYFRSSPNTTAIDNVAGSRLGNAG